jgi:CubicO group peptidase (beta-lactamase class C family)
MNQPQETFMNGIAGKRLDQSLTPLIEQVMKSHDLPGLAIGIVAENQIVFAKGFGVQSIDSREPVTIRTVFHMASVSKPFVATGIMQLVEQGKIRLDDPVVKHLPYIRLADERYREITVQQMLSHISSMPDVEDYEWDKPQYDPSALERFVRSLGDYQLLRPPGEKFTYSNMAFECLGDVIAKVSGMSFDDYIKEHILNPTGMSESTFLMKESLPSNWAAPHVQLVGNLTWQGYPYNRKHGPSSTLHANVPEMCRWALINLNRGILDGKRILEQSAYDLLWKPWAETGDGRQVGLSWFLKTYHGSTMIQHGGGDIGFRSHIALLPARKAAVVLMCNLIPAPIEELALAALDFLLGEEPVPVLPSAHVAVFRTLRQFGVEAAAAEWNALKADKALDYDFSFPHLFILYMAVSLDRLAEAEQIARFCALILSEEEVEKIREAYRPQQNRVAEAIIQVLK